MIQSLTDRIQLNNGTYIPVLGLGVFQIPEEQTAEVVKNGIVNGYRLIDTAEIYGNEKATGLGIQEGLKITGLQREDLFITTKVWNNHLTKQETKAAFEASLTRLQLEYVDLYLIHWPGNNSFEAAWSALEELYDEGKVKAIGVSNFQIHHLERLFSFAKVKPILNQIELHPKLAQNVLREFCLQHGIRVQAWSPLMQGELLNHPMILEIAEKVHQTTAQVILRWDIQQDILLVVKSVHSNRMLSNAAIFDFELASEDMARLNELNENLRVGPDPDTFDF